MGKIKKTDVHILLGLWSSGHSVSEIALLIHEQENTIRYHLKKHGVDIEDDPYQITGKSYGDYLDEDEARIRADQQGCHHHSFVCTFCRLYKDNIMTEQFQKIKSLEEENRRLKSIMEMNYN